MSKSDPWTVEPVERKMVVIYQEIIDPVMRSHNRHFDTACQNLYIIQKVLRKKHLMEENISRNGRSVRLYRG